MLAVAVANLLFLDSPVGVGFSYSDSSSDAKNLNDHITAEDTFAFLINWFLKYPDFKSQELYIVGESYAGTSNNTIAVFSKDK